MADDTPTIDELHTQARELEKPLADVRDQRAAAQRRIAERPTLEVAVERVARDRSSASSPQVEELRARVQDHYDEMLFACGKIDGIRERYRKVRRAHPALPAEQHLLDVFAEDVAWREANTADPDVQRHRIEIPAPVSL